MKMLPIDKANHAWIGSYAALAGWLVGTFLQLQWGIVLATQWSAVVGCVAAAVGRELYGLAKGRRFDTLDMAATIMGGAPVVIVA